MNFRRARKNEIGICAEILKDAFSSYSFFKVYVDNQKREKVFFDNMMDIWMKNSYKNGTVFVGTENSSIIAVAALRAPGDKDIAFIDCSVKGLKMAAACGIKNLKAFLKMCEASDDACHKLPDPKWHLVLLAVSGRYKGRGAGSSMLHDCIIPYVANNGGGLLTLNTNTQSNRVFYKKNGFYEFDETMLHENGKCIGNWSYKMAVVSGRAE